MPLPFAMVRRNYRWLLMSEMERHHQAIETLERANTGEPDRVAALGRHRAAMYEYVCQLCRALHEEGCGDE